MILAKHLLGWALLAAAAGSFGLLLLLYPGVSSARSEAVHEFQVLAAFGSHATRSEMYTVWL